MPFWHQWSCRWCGWRTQSFVENTVFEKYATRALKQHIKEQHKCPHCGAVGKGKKHEEACLRQRARKRTQKAKYKLKVAREAMVLICLADNETNQTPIATLTDDVLQCVFEHLKVQGD